MTIGIIVPTVSDKPASEASVATLRGIAKAKVDDKGARMSDDAKSVGTRAWQGDRVMITKADKPPLDLLPHADTPQVCKPGRLKGKIRLSADFDNTPMDIVDGFEDGL